MIQTISLLAALLATTAGAKSHLVISTDGPRLRVTIDGKAYGSFTSKELSIDDVAPGKHDVEVVWLDGGLAKAPVKKTVYTGKLSVNPGVEMRIRAVATGIEMTDEVALAQAPAPAAAPSQTQSFSNKPSNLHIGTDKMMMGVLVDGTPLQQDDCTSPKACVASDLAPGNHELEVRGGAFGTKVLYKGYVNLGGGAEVFGKVYENDFKVYNVQPRNDQGEVASVPVTTQQTTTTTVVNGNGAEGVHLGMSFIDPATGESVSMHVGAGPMGASSQVQQTTTTTTTSVAAAPVAVNGKGSLELTSEDGDSFTVYIDGKKVATFNGLEGQSIKVKNLAAGQHKLVIKDFMENKLITEGQLTVEPNFEIKLGKQGGQLENFNRENAFRAYR